MTQQSSFSKQGWKFLRATSQLGSDSFHKGTTRAYVQTFPISATLY